MVRAMKVVRSAAYGELKAMKTILARRPKVYHLSSDSDDWGSFFSGVGCFVSKAFC